MRSGTGAADAEAGYGCGDRVCGGWVCAERVGGGDDALGESDAKFPESRRIFQRDGNFYKAGETFKQPELARTLERIAADPEDFYKGKLAAEFATDGCLRMGG